MGADSEKIASFKTSLCYHQAKEQMRMFFLRGNDVDVEYLREAGILNKVIEVDTKVQVINILGYALKKPLADFDQMSIQQLERLLRTGNVCFIKEQSRKQLEKVVKQMRTFRFELIPLIVATSQDDPKKNLETILIKVHESRESSSAFSYVDISGRIYSSFANFLKDNILPPSILCYPQDGVVAFDDNNEVVADCCIVGMANVRKGATDMVIGVVGAASAVGTIFATGGLAVPFVLVSCGSALYTTGRSIEKLVDASVHGMSLNPFEDTEARNNWLMMSANLLTFASLGIAGLVTKLEGLTAAQISRFVLANRIIRGVSAGVNAITAIDSITYMVDNWKRMSIYERITVACAVCFCFREVISFANTERIMRNCQFEGICRFFKGCSNAVVGGASTVGQGFITNAKSMFDGNDEYLATGMKLIRTIVCDSFDVTISDDFLTIRLFGFEYKMRNIVRMGETELSKFLYTIQGIAKGFRDAFALLRVMCGDEAIMKATFKRAEQTGGNRADYGKAINELIEVFMVVRRICDDFSILVDAQLSIGSGHQFTVGSAYKTFVSIKGISLLRALVEMNSREANRMNSLRVQRGSKEADIFNFITHSSTDCAEMLRKIRFLLAVFEICTEKSIRITNIGPTEQIVVIESLVRVGLKQFNESSFPNFLIDPKLMQICQPALANHREFIDTVWNKTCTDSRASDRAFEKLSTLQMAFQSYSPLTMENVISYASTMECPDFARFTYHVLFALGSMDRFTREMGLDEAAANEILFSDPAALRSRFLELKMKAEELALGGYCPLDNSMGADDAQLIEMMKGLALKEQLRFGPVENGAFHLDLYPMLRFGTEIGKFNRYIAMKTFNHEEVQTAYDGKRMVYLANEQLRIVIGVVREVGAYIDTYSFT